MSSSAFRLPRPRFSLRLLLLAFTGFAIGFPIWYRWPYEEEESVYPRVNIGTASAVNIVPDKTRNPTGRIVTTWRRKWGGGQARHGPRTVYDHRGRVLSMEHYAHDQLHGPASWFDYWSADDDPSVPKSAHHTQPTSTRIIRGQYSAGKKSGIWTRSMEKVIHEKTGGTAFVKRETTTVFISEVWRDGKLDGPVTVKGSDKIAFTAHFEDGRLVALNGQPTEARLRQFLPRERVDVDRVALVLEQPSPIGAFTGPLMYLSPFFDNFSYPQGPSVICESPSVAEQNVQAGVDGIDLRTALFLATEPFGVGCDYRYGSLWFTTAEEARNWRDTTGVSEIQPPAGSALADVWDRPIDVTTEWRSRGSIQSNYAQPLAEILTNLAQQLGITIDVTRVEPTLDNPDGFPVTAFLSSLPFRHILGHILYRSGCRCELAGETLLILPPENGSQEP